MGKTQEAVAAFDFAIQRYPPNHPIRVQIEKIRKEL
jgi:hypothetical protein